MLIGRVSLNSGGVRSAPTIAPRLYRRQTVLCFVSKIRPDELDDRLDGAAPFLLDIRPAAEFEAGHIDGSHNVPVYGALGRGDDDALREQLDSIPRDQAIVTVCKLGMVATRATRVLEDEGYEATTLAGGMSGWRGYQKGSMLYKLWSVLWRLRCEGAARV